MKGILLVDKAAGMTSHDVVNRIRRVAGLRRVGHTGTLDPAATGLLILCLGGATRLSEFLTGLDKVYECTMRLGVVTDTYDLDGKVVEEHAVPELTREELQQVFDRFTGDIMQIPPMVSAVKIGGERLYKKARKGEWVEREPRPITIREFSLQDYRPPDALFRLRCTRGTYARSLCYDVGRVVGCGATLAALRRTWVGHHSVENARPTDSFVRREDVLERLLPMEKALALPEVVLRASSLKRLTSCAPLMPNDFKGACLVEAGWVQVKAESGELLAIAVVQPDTASPWIQPKRVLCRS
jgi:tRNA pseudouridine55 synthase